MLTSVVEVIIDKGHGFSLKILDNDADNCAVKITFITANASDTNLIHKIHINTPKQYLRNFSMEFETIKRFIPSLAFKRLSNLTK